MMCGFYGQKNALITRLSLLCVRRLFGVFTENIVNKSIGIRTQVDTIM